VNISEIPGGLPVRLRTPVSVGCPDAAGSGAHDAGLGPFRARHLIEHALDAAIPRGSEDRWTGRRIVTEAGQRGARGAMRDFPHVAA